MYSKSKGEKHMKTIRKVIAAFMIAVMAATVLSTTAFAASEQKKSTQMVKFAKQALEQADTDDLYTGTIDDPILIYYGSQPFTQPFTLVKWLTDNKKQKSPTYKGSLQDLSVGIVADLGNFYAKNYLSKTLTTLEDTSYDIGEGVKKAPDEIVDKIATKTKAPIVSDLYEMTGPAGKIAMMAVLFPGYLATNAGALVFVLVGGGVALAVIFGLTGVMSPLLAIKEGPRVIEQFFRDINEMENAVDAAK